MTILDTIAHAIADGSWDYEKTGKPERDHYLKAERVIAALRKVGYTRNIEELIYRHV